MTTRHAGSCATLSRSRSFQRDDGGMLVSHHRVVIGDTLEDLRRFEDEELSDPWLDPRERVGIELRRRLRRWWGPVE